MNNLKMGLVVILCLVCANLLLMSEAQDTTQMTRTGVTGCLEKGHDDNEYELIAENAKWRLKSDNVSLADQVGHKIKVDGVVSNQPYHGMKEDLKAEVEKHPIETGVLIVKNLETVNDSCN